MEKSADLAAPETARNRSRRLTGERGTARISIVGGVLCTVLGLGVFGLPRLAGLLAGADIPGVDAENARSAAGGAGRGSADLTVEEWSSKGDPREPFGAIMGMAAGSDGGVWVSDGLNHAVSLAFEGDRAEPRARTGRGPGEVTAPALIARRPEGGVAVHDVASRKLELFGADGRYERSVRLPYMIYNPKALVALRSGEFVISGGVAADPYAIHRFAADGTHLNSWHPAPALMDERAVRIVAGGALAELPNGNLLFSQSAPHRIVEYRLDGTPVRTIASHPQIVPAPGDDIVRVESDGVAFRWGFRRSSAVFVLPGGERFLNVVRDGERQETTFEVWSMDGERVDHKLERATYDVWDLAPDGRLIASYRDPDTEEHVAQVLRVNLRR